jgi:putative ABC transport system permease protein
MASAASVRAALSRIDPELPVSRIRTMEQVLEQSLGSRRFPMLLLGIFSAVALALAVIGVYGVVSYLVSQRAREIGIRVALGARRRDVVGLIVRRATIPIAIGLAAGVFGALASSRLLESLLYQVTPSDPVVLSTIVGILGGAALIATLMPARRAAGVDPLVVLKVD